MVTHLEVLEAKQATKYGVQNGQLLAVYHETNKFYFVRSHANTTSIKVSKHQKRAVSWNKAGAPTFNI